MRHAGRITEWHDDKGYGFVTPNGGGDRAFVHIKALGRTSRRPTAGTLISYATVRDDKGRLNATEVRFAGSPTRAAASSHRGFPSTGIALGIFIALALALAWYFAVISHALSLLYAGMSLLALALYGIDKSAAKVDRRRIPENTLHLVALLGGWPGALLAQRLFRHKSRKPAFQVVFWVTVVLNLAGLAWLLSDGTL